MPIAYAMRAWSFIRLKWRSIRVRYKRWSVISPAAVAIWKGIIWPRWERSFTISPVLVTVIICWPAESPRRVIFLAARIIALTSLIPFQIHSPPPLVCAFWVCCTVELISLAKHLKNVRIRCFSALLKRLKTLNLEPPKGWISSTVTRFPFSLQNLTKIKAWYSIFNHSFYTATLRNVP